MRIISFFLIFNVLYMRLGGLKPYHRAYCIYKHITLIKFFIYDI